MNGGEISLESPLLFRSATENSTAEGYNQLFAKTQRPYKVKVAKDNIPQILQDRLENTVCIHRATLAPISERYWELPTEEKDKNRSEKEPRSKKVWDVNHVIFDVFGGLDWALRSFGAMN